MQVIVAILSAVAALVLSLLAARVLLWVLPDFRSREIKAGSYRSDKVMADAAIGTSRLPLLGGTALVCGVGGASGLAVGFRLVDWPLGALAFMCLLCLVGLVDDYYKTRGVGIGELGKLIGVLAVSFATALWLYRYAGFDHPHAPFDLLPVIGSPPGWSVFYLMFATLLLVASALSADFMDGVDGLASGVGMLAALAYAGIAAVVSIGLVGFALALAAASAGVLAFNQPSGWSVFYLMFATLLLVASALSADFMDGVDGLASGVGMLAALAYAGIAAVISIGLAGFALALAAASAGVLAFNQPSGWSSRPNSPQRRARLYLGDSGALALGGGLGLVALLTRTELLWVVVGGVFVLEGVSSLVQAKLLTPFYRRFLEMPRFATASGRIPHTEFPLPFLATPLHYHLDLLGIGRLRIVKMAYLLGGVLGLCGIGAQMASGPLRWMLWCGGLATILGVLVWANLTTRFFVGIDWPRTCRADQALGSAGAGDRRPKLALYNGLPYHIFGRRCYRLYEPIDLLSDTVASGPLTGMLWKTGNLADARAVLGWLYLAAGRGGEAARQWEQLPVASRDLRGLRVMDGSSDGRQVT